MKIKLSRLTSSGIVVKKLRGDLWKLNENIVIELKIKDGGVIRVTIKKGFEFNFRSGSRFLNTSIPKIGNMALVWLFHDAIYCDHLMTREMCDELMYQGLKLQGLSTWRAWAAWVGVRAGGSSAWNEESNQKHLIDLTWSDK